MPIKWRSSLLHFVELLINRRSCPIFDSLNVRENIVDDFRKKYCCPQKRRLTKIASVSSRFSAKRQWSRQDETHVLQMPELQLPNEIYFCRAHDCMSTSSLVYRVTFLWKWTIESINKLLCRIQWKSVQAGGRIDQEKGGCYSLPLNYDGSTKWKSSPVTTIFSCERDSKWRMCFFVAITLITQPLELVLLGKTDPAE